MSNKRFCPMINDDCRRDCQWCDPVTELTDDGIMETLECAMMDIAAGMLALSGIINDDGWLADE